jgi:hypothetical protein
MHDTCGVHSLHGMPGVFAAIVSMFVLIDIKGRGFSEDYFAAGSSKAQVKA